MIVPDFSKIIEAFQKTIKLLIPLALLGVYQIGEWAYWLLSHLKLM